MEKTRILLVDDEEEFVRVLSERLESRGVSVATAQSGAEAIRAVKDKNFDAVILDMVMPGMGGITILQNLLREKPGLHVIVLTGHASVSGGIDAMKHGAMDFLEKPADIEKLVEKINEAKKRQMIPAAKRA